MTSLNHNLQLTNPSSQEPVIDSDEESLATMDVFGNENVDPDATPPARPVGRRTSSSDDESTVSEQTLTRASRFRIPSCTRGLAIEITDPDGNTMEHFPARTTRPIHVDHDTTLPVESRRSSYDVQSTTSQQTPPSTSRFTIPRRSVSRATDIKASAGKSLGFDRSAKLAARSDNIGPAPNQLPPSPTRSEARRETRLALASVTELPYGSALPSAGSSASPPRITRPGPSPSGSQESLSANKKEPRLDLLKTNTGSSWKEAASTTSEAYDSTQVPQYYKATSRPHPFDPPSDKKERTSSPDQAASITSDRAEALAASMHKTIEEREKRFRRIQRDATKGTSIPPLLAPKRCRSHQLNLEIACPVNPHSQA